MAQISWESFDRGVFLLNCLAIIPRNGKILIGRRVNDPYVKELTWCFPGSRPNYGESLTDSLKREVERKTGLRIEVLKSLFARTLPERPEFLLLYYAAKLMGGNEEVREPFVELRWVKPTEALRLFTTSVDPWIKELLISLEKSGGQW